jgi:hypothetical protein
MLRYSSRRQFNFISRKRENKRKHDIDKIRADAETRREEAYNKKHGKLNEKKYLSQKDHLRKYFVIE